MKLIEVVVLMGAHCISPVQNTEAITEAAKVQCAVVVEKDAEEKTVRVIPAGASTHPQVVAVIERFNADLGAGSRIEPAFAPPGNVPVKRARPLAGAMPAQEEEPAGGAAETVAPQRDAAVEEEKAGPAEKPNKPAALRKAQSKTSGEQKTKTADKRNSECRGSAVPKWYTTPEGRKKYRCVRPD